MAELIDQAAPGVVARVCSTLRHGGLVVIPTDTVYGLAALPSSDDAIAAVFAAKRRPEGMHLAVLLAGPEQLPLVTTDTRPSVGAIADSFWPGALTLVLPQATVLVSGLGNGDGTVGVRCPADELIRAVVEDVGPIATTSANIHGQPTPARALEVLEQIPEVDLAVDGGERSGSAPSTVVSLIGNKPEVLRAGPVSLEDLMAHWAE
ncbi:MAG: L-threonylcarbamoyladenylate synthase [Acidimicrobiales bacterium]